MKALREGEFPYSDSVQSVDIDGRFNSNNDDGRGGGGGGGRRGGGGGQTKRKKDQGRRMARMMFSCTSGSNEKVRPGEYTDI